MTTEMLRHDSTGLPTEQAPSPLASVADTGRWVAYYRALESERPDALVHDPYARRLAGARGEQMYWAMPSPETASGLLVQRTLVFDELVMRAINRDGVDLVLNLAAGLDTRPYRLLLPPSLRWLEVDLPDVMAHKQAVLGYEPPICRVERFSLDLRNRHARRALFARANAEARRVLVVTEGLLLYLPPDEVADLASDLHAEPRFVSWLADLLSPRAARRMGDLVGTQLAAARAPIHFAPADGADFFRPFGWELTDYRPALLEAHRLGRDLPVARYWRSMLRVWLSIRKTRRDPLAGTIRLQRASRHGSEL